MVRRRAALVGAVVAAVLVAVVGCSGAPAEEPEPEPTWWQPDITRQEAYDLIPLAGTRQAPLYWETLELEDEELAAAQWAAQHYRALDFARYASATPDADAYLYQWLATDRMLEARFADGPPDPDTPSIGQTAGPVWLRVMVVEPGLAPNQILVSVCEDDGWNDAVGAENLPKSNRAFMEHYLLEARVRFGELMWLVDRSWPDRDQHGPEVRRECEEWATHEPGDE